MVAKKKRRSKGEREVINEHAAFFDRLIELIPARFYVFEDTEKPWFQGLSKAEKEQKKRETRENIKKARRDRMDPDKSLSTLDILKQKISSTASAETDKHQDHSVTYEELRFRLHGRIESLRSGRTAKNVEEEDTECAGEDQAGEGDAAAAAEGLMFGRLNTEGGERERKRPPGRRKELERAVAVKEEGKKDPQVKGKNAWATAVSRASGVKVHDDPKLIKRSMHREEKRREKSASQWEERAANVRNSMSEKQRIRAHNISDRIKKKRQRRIEKREKKLARPGFEGRKQGFITTSSAHPP